MARRRLNLQEASGELGLTIDALRKRVKRGVLKSERGTDGRIYVFLDTDQESDYPRSDSERLISTLEEQLRLEREAHAEARRLLAAALERIPALEPSAETRESPEAPAEDVGSGDVPPRRSWWRRMFGG
jgi:hypothetical protein